MSAASRKSSPKTSKDTPSATSSPASGSGAMPLERLDGQTILPFGQALVPARVSVQAGSGAASAISVTYGPHGSGSSASYALSMSLANRLRAVTGSLGSTLFRLTWKERVTPSGRRIPALRASGRRTSGSGCTSWPAPNSMQGGQTSRGGERKDELLMGGLLKAARWATPTSRDYKSEGTLELTSKRIKRSEGKHLTLQARLTASGGMRNGCGAETGSTGQLNPEHSRWLMGCPAVWEECLSKYEDWRSWQDFLSSLSPKQRAFASEACGVTVTRLSRRKRLSSSAPTVRPD